MRHLLKRLLNVFRSSMLKWALQSIGKIADTLTCVLFLFPTNQWIISIANGLMDTSTLNGNGNILYAFSERDMVSETWASQFTNAFDNMKGNLV